jgi:hypothetical protein
MEDEDYRVMVLNDTTMKVFRDGRFHTYDNYHSKWIDRKIIPRENDGYCHFSIGNPRKEYYVHHVIALCYLGEKPDGYQVDHINNIRTDNRLENLQYLPKIDNDRKRLNNIKGQLIKGYYLAKNGKFQARITHYGKIIYLGSYGTKEEARQAYIEGKLKYHGVVVSNI